MIHDAVCNASSDSVVQITWMPFFPRPFALQRRGECKNQESYPSYGKPIAQKGTVYWGNAARADVQYWSPLERVSENAGAVQALKKGSLFPPLTSIASVLFERADQDAGLSQFEVKSEVTLVNGATVITSSVHNQTNSKLCASFKIPGSIDRKGTVFEKSNEFCLDGDQMLLTQNSPVPSIAISYTPVTLTDESHLPVGFGYATLYVTSPRLSLLTKVAIGAAVVGVGAVLGGKIAPSGKKKP